MIRARFPERENWPVHYCPRCARRRRFRTWINGLALELRCAGCRWLLERVKVLP